MVRQKEIVNGTGSRSELRRAFEECIGAGGVVLFPADGVYGLACDPLDPAAVDRIHAIKGRDDGKPSAIMYFSPLAARELIAEFPEPVRVAAGRLLPGPVTLIVPNPAGRYPLACRTDRDRLGVRLIEGPLNGVMTPVFQTSANRSGRPAPYRYEDVDPAIVSSVDLAIDGGELGGAPSTVVDLTGLAEDTGFQILREGAFASAEIEAGLADLASTRGIKGR